jgi:hypothetical protein
MTTFYLRILIFFKILLSHFVIAIWIILIRIYDKLIRLLPEVAEHQLEPVLCYSVVGVALGMWEEGVDRDLERIV